MIKENLLNSAPEKWRSCFFSKKVIRERYSVFHCLENKKIIDKKIYIQRKQIKKLIHQVTKEEAENYVFLFEKKVVNYHNYPL